MKTEVLILNNRYRMIQRFEGQASADILERSYLTILDAAAQTELSPIKVCRGVT